MKNAPGKLPPTWISATARGSVSCASAGYRKRKVERNDKGRKPVFGNQRGLSNCVSLRGAM